jgi:hypothetical protein
VRIVGGGILHERQSLLVSPNHTKIGIDGTDEGFFVECSNVNLQIATKMLPHEFSESSEQSPIRGEGKIS